MALEIANSAVAIVSVNLTDLNWPTLSDSPNSVLASIQQELAFDGLTIAQSDVGLSALAFAVTGQFSATLQILNQSGQELDDTDLEAQFNDACASVNVRQQGFGVLQIIGGSGGVNSGTGTQGNVVVTGAGNAQNTSTPGGVPACGDPNLTIWKYPQQFFSCLTSKGLTTIGLLAIGVLVGVVLLVTMEHRPSVSV